MTIECVQTVPARHGFAVRLDVGQAIEIINLHGTQAVDVWAFAAEDMTEFMAMDQTRSVNSSIHVRRGQTLFSDRRRPMLELVEDTSPGVHDTLLCACNPAIYRELGCAPDHRSCVQNLHEALAAIGLASAITPAPLNLFMNVSLTADGTIDRHPPISRPGDSVVLRARMDAVVALSACPQDVTPINGAARTPRDIGVRILSR